MKRLRIEGSARRAGVAVAVALFVTSVATAGRAESPLSNPAGFSRAGLERVGDYMRNEVATGKIPGAIVLIQQHGRPVYFEKFGVLDVESKRPMTEDAIFRLYSMSKPI